MIRAVIFDIGQTLVEYRKPLNWSRLYRPALEQAAAACGDSLSEEELRCAEEILSAYNTRLHPREYEVSSTRIFTEILQKIHRPLAHLPRMKAAFYGYFRNEAAVFPEAPETLAALRAQGILLGTLSDVAYGMDNCYALEDLAALRKEIDFPWTSHDSGFRKPSPKGLLCLLERMGAAPSEALMVGDEEKDILCARGAGVLAVLVNRTGTPKPYGQDAEIRSLSELLPLVR